MAIAANVVVFGLVNGLFLRPFPFPEPDRLVYINETAPRWNLEVVGVNFPDFVQWRQGSKLFDGIALYDGESFNVSDGAGAERIEGARVTHDFAAVLGVRPILGRTFTPEEDRPKAERVVVINEGLWRERFDAARRCTRPHAQAERRGSHDRGSDARRPSGFPATSGCGCPWPGIRPSSIRATSQARSAG